MCKPILFLALILASFRSFPCHAVDQPRAQDALARYVTKQDESFEWKIRRMGIFKNRKGIFNRDLSIVNGLTTIHD